MSKNKKTLAVGATLLLMIWCTKGYWSDDAEPLNKISESKKLTAEGQQSVVERDRIISSLKLEISNLQRTCGSAAAQQKYSIPKIYAITPTYARPVQKAELTRLSHTLMLVPNLHWVVIEDAPDKTELVTNLLRKTGMSYTHLNAATPATWKLKAKEPRYNKPRGVLQRNTALEWLRQNVPQGEEGVLYFADDDNAYSLEVFDEMRGVQRVGVWPVGLVGGLMVERPKVDARGKVVGWLTVWSPKRPFAIDMAGFAVNLKLFMERTEGKFAYEVAKGYQESEFLRHFVDSLDDVEVKADNCTKVYVWHTRTESPPLREEIALKKAGKPPSHQGIEV